MNLLIVGAGGYGQLVKELGVITGFDWTDFLDDNSEISVGKIGKLEILQENYDGCVVAIGNSEIRKKIFQKVKNPITLVHPRAVISTDAYIDICSFVCAGAVVPEGTKVLSCTVWTRRTGIPVGDGSFF